MSHTLGTGRPPAVTMHLQLKPTSLQMTMELRKRHQVTTELLQLQTTDINEWWHSGRNSEEDWDSGTGHDDLIASLSGDIPLPPRQAPPPTTGLWAQARLVENCCGRRNCVVSVSSFTGGL